MAWRSHWRRRMVLIATLAYLAGAVAPNATQAQDELAALASQVSKLQREGKYSEAIAIHDLCAARGIPVWCGGMLESGIGRAHNIALASLPDFTLPGDISASSRYFEHDLISPEVTVASDGTVAVPDGIGLGFNVELGFIERQTETRVYLSRK